MTNIFSSATRVTLLLMVVALVGINVFALIKYPDTLFNTTFLVFKDIVLMIATYFFAKSSNDGLKPSVQNVENEKVIEKASIDPASV